MLSLFGKKRKYHKKTLTGSTRSAHYESAASKLIFKNSISGNNIDDIIESQYNALQSRARHAYCNNDYVKGFINQACINVIGNKGIKIQAKLVDEKLNKKIETNYRRWSKRSNCDVTASMSFVDIQLLELKSLLRDGEFFIIKNVIDGRLQLQLIEPSKIDIQYKAKLNNQREIINGVEVDSFGKKIAYYFFNDDYSRTRIPAKKVIHGFIQDFVGQKRGISAVATALIRLGLLGQFETAAIDNARQAAQILGFASKPQSDYEPINSSFEDDTESQIKEINIGEGAALAIADDGYDIKKIDSQFPSSEYGNFKDAILRAVSLSLGYGINFINLGNNLEKVNYSSARQGMLAERDSWKLLQNLMIETLIEPVFEAWLEVEILSGRLGFIADNQYLEILDKIRYQPRSWAWIDPLKDAKGISENLRNKTLSTSEAILETGRDPDDVFEQIAKDKQKMQDLDIYEEFLDDSSNEYSEEQEQKTN